MSKVEEFGKVMREQSLEHLNKVINSKNGEYVDDAIEAARIEIKRRESDRESAINSLKESFKNKEPFTIDESNDSTLRNAVNVLKFVSVLVLIGGLISSVYYYNNLRNPMLTITISIVSSIVSASMFYTIARCGEYVLKNNK